MALQLSKLLRKGIPADECYAKILEFRFVKENINNTEKDVIIINLAFYYNKKARDDNFNNYIEVRSYVLDDLTKDSRKKVYTHLKSLDEFTNSVNI